MRANLILIAALLLAGARTFAQQGTMGASHTEKTPAVSRSDTSHLGSPPASGSPQAHSGAFVTKHPQARGLLADLLRTRKPLDIPGRLGSLINPFAKSASTPEPELNRNMDSRAWTTIVGWKPSASAFADPITHESTLGLLSIGSSK
jgi:hypothetical protein